MLDIRTKKLNTFVFLSRDDKTLNAIRNYFTDNVNNIHLYDKKNFLYDVNQYIKTIIANREYDIDSFQSFFLLFI